MQLTDGVVYIVEESVVDREARSVEVYTHIFPINSLYQVVEKSIFTISPLNSKWSVHEGEVDHAVARIFYYC